MDDETIIGGCLSIIAVIVVIILLAMWKSSLNATCQQLFGNEWTGRTALYSQDVCVNKQGEVKYP